LGDYLDLPPERGVVLEQAVVVLDGAMGEGVHAGGF